MFNTDKLLRFANTKIGRLLFGVKENYPVVKITPSSTHYRTDKGEIKAVFGKRKPIGLLLHFWDKIANKFFPNLNLGFDTFTSSTFLGGAGRFKYGTAANWAEARDAAAAKESFATYEVNSDSDGSANSWIIQRVFLPIDTSSIPDTATITAVALNFNARYEGGFTGTEVHLIQTTQATTASRDLNDYNNVAFTSGGSVTTPDAALTAKTINGNATSLGWIVKAGTTLIALITTADLNNTDPNGGTDHWCTITSPELVVTYTLPASGINSFKTLLGVGL